MKILLAILMAVMLSSCAWIGVGLKAGADKIKQSTDIQAQTTQALQCAIPYGAYTRLPLNQQLSIELTCGGDWLETLQRLGVMKSAVKLNGE